MNLTTNKMTLSAFIVGTYFTAMPVHAENYNSGHSVSSFQVQEEKKDWEVSLGAGALFSPEYEGGEDYEFLPVPYIDISYKDIVTFNPFSGLRYNAFKSDNITLGAGLGFDFGREEDDADRLRGLGDVDSTVEGQLFAAYQMGTADAEITYSQDLGDGHDGYTLKAEVGVIIPVPQYSIFMRPSIGTTYGSDSYMESYFGVSNAQSGRSGLSRFDAEAGFKDVQVSLLTIYQINPKWIVSGLVQYKQLLGDAADSPIVEEEGQMMGGAFIAYKF